VVDDLSGHGSTASRDADSDVAQANKMAAESLERAVKAEQAAAEANLARAQMERRLVRLAINRRLTDEEIEALEERLKPFAGQPFVVTFAPTDNAATDNPRWTRVIRRACHATPSARRQSLECRVYYCPYKDVVPLVATGGYRQTSSCYSVPQAHLGFGSSQLPRLMNFFVACDGVQSSPSISIRPV